MDFKRFLERQLWGEDFYGKKFVRNLGVCEPFQR